jgi:hypothetical protein
MMVAVTRPKPNGTRVAIWARKAAAMTFRLGVSAGMYRDQSPRNAPNEIGLDMTISADPMKDGQNSALVAASAPCPNVPAYDASNVPAKATIPSRKSRDAATTAILLTQSMKRNP